MSKQDTQTTRTVAGLEQKYSFGKQFAEVMGIALDTQKSVTEVESTLSDRILEQSTTMARDTERIIMTALQKYVEKEDFEELETTLKTEFGVWAEGVAIRTTKVEERLEEVNGEMKTQLNTIAKYFSFTVDGLEIGATYIDEKGEEKKSPNKVVIDNDDITILVNDKVVQAFKADGTGLIPTLNVTKAANILGLQFTSDDTHINCDFKEVT